MEVLHEKIIDAGNIITQDSMTTCIHRKGRSADKPNGGYDDTDLVAGPPALLNDSTELLELALRAKECAELYISEDPSNLITQ